ncbi:pyrroloquinoline quinone biosynthesis protein PqqB [Actinomadura barringtoniae]|uniref:Coenzyme PQQ synthesis protein B n=1 Tax=Actinomadura barringtoniae TaxID=1427535 RepID=A0A939PNP2_9ACTN|nr:MBL fold metallo-hydrolase [Actinomadura barringtoniae]MBO2455368.1 pyrroloquinoline quinone biosynthesis protein PqqB [Actinomadura barringtoniae]
MEVRLLGTAAGGGVPQWNCACAGCSGARQHPGRRRLHASLAVRARGGDRGSGRWWLVNATPDIGEQVEAFGLWPTSGRDSPITGVVLTDAELDHTLGIARLREADRIEVTGTGAVRDAVSGRLGGLLEQYAELKWQGFPVVDGDLVIESVPISGKRPRYARDARAGPDDVWVSALKITDRSTGGVLVYAPAAGDWPDALQEAIDGADCVIVDGTFWDDDEPRTTGISERTATQMGHLPIAGGTSDRLAELRGRRLYTHLNNTNPLVDPGAPQHAALAELGLEVAQDGMVIEL